MPSHADVSATPPVQSVLVLWREIAVRNGKCCSQQKLGWKMAGQNNNLRSHVTTRYGLCHCRHCLRKSATPYKDAVKDLFFRQSMGAVKVIG